MCLTSGAICLLLAMRSIAVSDTQYFKFSISFFSLEQQETKAAAPRACRYILPSNLSFLGQRLRRSNGSFEQATKLLDQITPARRDDANSFENRIQMIRDRAVFARR